MVKVSLPSGVPLVDALVAAPSPTVQEYVAAVSAYVLIAGQLDQNSKKRAQMYSSLVLGRIVLGELEARIPGLDGHAGERRVKGALRAVNADLSTVDPVHGLRLAVEVKPVLLAVGKAVWNRFGDIVTFAVNLHLGSPPAVLGALVPVSTWEEVPRPGGRPRDRTGLVARLAAAFAGIRGRQTATDSPHLLEAIGLVAFNPLAGGIVPDLPPIGTGLRWEEFIDQLVIAYQQRFGTQAVGSPRYGSGRLRP